MPSNRIPGAPGADEPARLSTLESVILLPITATPDPLTINDLERHLCSPELTDRPTVSELSRAVRGLIALGRLVDGFDPKVRGSKHILRIPPPQSTPTLRGLFE